MASRLYVLGVRPDVDDGRLYGIVPEERIHMAVFGSTGTGKSTLLLNLIKQNIERGEGFMLIDPDGDTALKCLTLVPDNMIDNVVYIDPTTAFTHKRVVQINFLEYTSVLDKGTIARSFTDALQKIYSKFWGPRLDYILLNTIYALLDAPEGSVNLNDVYYMLVDEEKRKMYLTHVRDEKVLDFWERAYERIPDEASASVLTKIYRIIQEKMIQPMFDCYRSSINVRKLMDEGKFVIVNLSEGKLGSEVANFTGSLLMSMVYLAGMSRIDTSEEARRPFFLYVDEAYRFISLGAKDIIQSLRKYKVYATFAAHYINQYQAELSEAIPALCSTFICFRVDEDTAKKLEKLFTPITKEDLVKLPNYVFAVSIEHGQRRISAVLRGLVPKPLRSDVAGVIERSLQIYGREVEAEKYTAEFRDDYPYPKLSPIAYIVLQTFRRENVAFTMEKLYERLSKDFYVMKSDVQRGVSELHRERLVEPVSDIDPETRRTIVVYRLSPAVLDFFGDVPYGARGGGDKHTAIVDEYLANLRPAGYYCIVDLGNDIGKQRPDILVYAPRFRIEDDGARRLDCDHWDYRGRYAIEVEINPEKHISPDPENDRIYHNCLKNKARGVPTLFVVENEEAKRIVETDLREKLGKDYERWVKGVEVWRPTGHPPILFGEQQLLASEAGKVQVEREPEKIEVKVKEIEPATVSPPKAEVAQEPAREQAVEEKPAVEEKRVKETVREKPPEPIEQPGGEERVEQEEVETLSVDSDTRRKLDEILAKDARLAKALKLKSEGWTEKISWRKDKPLLFMEKGSSVVYIGDLSYALVKGLGLNIPPSNVPDRLMYYLEKGWRIRCNGRGYVSLRSPNPGEGEAYAGRVVDESGTKIPDEVQKVFNLFGYEAYVEGGSVKVRRVKKDA
jgi:hypothetical protein